MHFLSFFALFCATMYFLILKSICLAIVQDGDWL